MKRWFVSFGPLALVALAALVISFFAANPSNNSAPTARYQTIGRN